MTQRQVMNQTEMMSLYKCGFCHNFKYNTVFMLERHMLDQHSGFGFQCQECHKVFMRRDYQHRGCKNGEAGGKKLKLVDRQSHSFGEKEENKYKQFKRDMRQMIVEVKERKATPNGNHDLNKINKSKPEYKRRNEFGNYTIPKKTRQEETNKENISLPSTKKIISPISSIKSNENQVRRLILAPKQLIVQPDPTSYPPVLIPPPPPPPKSVSTSIFNETTITNENVIINDNFSEETAENHLNSCVISICPRQDEYNLHFTETEEYIIPDVPNEIQPSYNPTPTHILLLRGLNEAQQRRITLNIGGTKFESCAQTLQNDPSSLLSRMLAPDSPFQPYIQEPLPSYFLDRDPRHFVHILNYLRSNCSSELSTFPRNIIHLRELQKESSFYKLEHLGTLLENRCLEILQGTLDRDIL
ncbi:uncharacterized protein LOC134685257 [Mytilus trossulus]|uniref:uncharacterized protein LOC134685257 n=1 Tax=Mytilus trossulus TaxID=6551 RepID=UPI003003F5F6